MLSENEFEDLIIAISLAPDVLQTVLEKVEDRLVLDTFQSHVYNAMHEEDIITLLNISKSG